MKVNWGIAILVVLVSVTWGASLAAAQGEVTLTPTQFTLEGPVGTVDTRMLLLQTTRAITELQIISLDLDRSPEGAVLPAGAVRAAVSASAVKTNGLLTVPVTIDLRNAPSGKFTGQMLVRFYDGKVPVQLTVSVKDQWPLPLIVLVIGVMLGIFLSAYRAQGKPRDEVLVRMDDLRAQMKADVDLPPAFHKAIDTFLVDVETALQDQNWDAAKTAMTQAETIWNRWRRRRSDWLAQFAYRAEITKHLDEQPHQDARYIRTVRRALEDAAEKAAELDDPDKFRDLLDPLGDQVDHYLVLQSRLGELNALRDELPAEPSDEKVKWEKKIRAWQDDVDALSPTDAAAYAALRSELDTAVTELTALLHPAKGVGGLEGLVIPGMALAQRLLPAAPGSRSLPEVTVGARFRLQYFVWASYALAVIFLVGAGFNELYVTKATFGAAAWGDYLALLVWGFGAEATSASITGVVNSWNLPGVKRGP